MTDQELAVHPLRKELEAHPEYIDLRTRIGKLDQDRLTLAYGMTPKKAQGIVAAHFRLPVDDVEMVRHKHGGMMFFANYHRQTKLYKTVGQLGAVSTRRKWQKGTIFSGHLWVREKGKA